MTVAPRIGIVIPNYRRADLVIACLASLRKAIDLVDGPVDTVVVDDGSDDDSSAAISQAHPWVRVERHLQNRGYPAAVNTGIRATTAAWILTLNNDTVVDPRFLIELLEVAESAADDVGSLAAQQRFSDRPDTIYSAGILIDRVGVTADRLIGSPISASETRPKEVFGACGAAAAYSRRLLDDVGLLDEEFRFGLEDADLAWRARMRGWRCLYVPAAVIYHDVGGTVPYGTDLRFLQAGRNRVRLVIKNADRSLILRYGVLMVAYDAAYVLAVAIRHRTLAPVRGRLESLRAWRAIRRSGDRDRRPVSLAPIMGIRAALTRRTYLMRLRGSRGALPE